MTRKLWDLVGRCVTISLHRVVKVDELDLGDFARLQVTRNLCIFASQNVTLSLSDFEFIWVHDFMLKSCDFDAEDEFHLVCEFEVISSCKMKAHEL